jgi:predicted transglutaminase-like cysteine proteinase
MLNSGPIIVARVDPMAPVTSAPQNGLGTSGNYNVFHSVAISAGNLPTLAKWRQATSGDYTALFGANCAVSGLANCNSPLAKRLQAVAQRAGGMSSVDMLGLVNREVNAAMRYQSDRGNWGKTDYWANPVEMAGKGAGDCEDFALEKMWMLRSLGFSPSSLQLIVLEDTRKGVFHAVLAAHIGAQAYILDNLSTNVSTDGAFASYMPIMSFVGTKGYIHGFTAQGPALAALPSDLSSVMPGEGV